MAVMIMVVGVVITAPTATLAHRAGRADADTFISYTGILTSWLENNYGGETTFIVEVLDRELNEVPEDRWRTNLVDDRIVLGSGERINVIVETRDEGKYYVCTRALEVVELLDRSNVDSRICFRHWHR